MWLRLLILFVIFNFRLSFGDFSVPDLPEQHYEPWVRGLEPNRKQELIDRCKNTTAINTVICDALKKSDLSLRCWGYEDDASGECLLTKPECSTPAPTWAPNHLEQLRMFYKTADFGYVKEQRQELSTYCRPLPPSEKLKFRSELKCSKYLRYCAGKNLFLDLKNLQQYQEESIRYREDFLQPGQIGGWNCELDKPGLAAQGGHKSPLMSWFGEFERFEVNQTSSSLELKCDHVFEKPLIVMKLDAPSNLYHHFCDFVNLYISLHVNGSWFDRDNHVLIWDNHPYRSAFSQTFKAFTQNPILHLGSFTGKRICARNVYFPLLPRMIYGMYYNMPLIPGCSSSGIFRAFNRHILHYFRDKHSEDLKEKDILVTFISRRTKHRKVLNENELIDGLRSELKRLGIGEEVRVQTVNFDHRMNFLEQVEISSQSDVLIGIHGAGLTHTLFQPDFGVLFELYNCDDPDCYSDLSRLRGTEYMTWEKKELLQTVNSDCSNNSTCLAAQHSKFVDYKFDVDEFVRKSMLAIKNVKLRKAAFFSENRHNARFYDEL